MNPGCPLCILADGAGIMRVSFPPRRSAMPAVTASPLAASLKPSEAELPQITHWISGARVGGSSGRFADVFHPASGHAQARVPLASDAEVDRAVAAAAAVFPEWSSQPPLR